MSSPKIVLKTKHLEQLNGIRYQSSQGCDQESTRARFDLSAPLRATASQRGPGSRASTLEAPWPKFVLHLCSGVLLA